MQTVEAKNNWKKRQQQQQSCTRISSKPKGKKKSLICVCFSVLLCTDDGVNQMCGICNWRSLARARKRRGNTHTVTHFTRVLICSDFFFHLFFLALVHIQQIWRICCRSNRCDVVNNTDSSHRTKTLEA